MSSLSFNSSALPLFDTVSALTSFVLRQAERAIRFNEDRWAIRQLRELTDQELLDIGLLRCDIEAAVTGAQRPGALSRKSR